MQSDLLYEECLVHFLIRFGPEDAARANATAEDEQPKQHVCALPGDIATGNEPKTHHPHTEEEEEQVGGHGYTEDLASWKGHYAFEEEWPEGRCVGGNH